MYIYFKGNCLDKLCYYNYPVIKTKFDDLYIYIIYNPIN